MSDAEITLSGCIWSTACHNGKRRDISMITLSWSSSFSVPSSRARTEAVSAFLNSSCIGSCPLCFYAGRRSGIPMSLLKPTCVRSAKCCCIIVYMKVDPRGPNQDWVPVVLGTNTQSEQVPALKDLQSKYIICFGWFLLNNLWTMQLACYAEQLHKRSNIQTIQESVRRTWRALYLVRQCDGMHRSFGLPLYSLWQRTSQPRSIEPVLQSESQQLHSYF